MKPRQLHPWQRHQRRQPCDGLSASRRAGTVRNLADRRFDLYRIVWSDADS